LRNQKEKGQRTAVVEENGVGSNPSSAEEKNGWEVPK